MRISDWSSDVCSSDLRFLTDLDDVEEETVAIAARFAEMAEAVAFALTADDPAGLMQFLVTRPHPDLCTQAGAFSSYRGKKGKWGAVAKRAGMAKADGNRLNDAAEGHIKACSESLPTMLKNIASRGRNEA